MDQQIVLARMKHFIRYTLTVMITVLLLSGCGKGDNVRMGKLVKETKELRKQLQVAQQELRAKEESEASLTLELEATKKQLGATSISDGVYRRQYQTFVASDKKLKARIKQLEESFTSLNLDDHDKRITREAFQEKVIGMSTTELVDLLGKPTVTSSDKEWWSYRVNRTYDRKTGTYDLELKFHIEDGLVSEIFFK